MMKKTSIRALSCIDRAMELWNIHGEKYSTCLERYHSLLEKRRKLGIEPLRKVTKTILLEYPDIPFLKIQREEEARLYLATLSAAEIQKLIKRVEYVTECDYAYRTLSERVIEFQYQVDNYDKRSYYGVDPDLLGGRKRGRNRRINERR